jgi:hypothetical protein
MAAPAPAAPAAAPAAASASAPSPAGSFSLERFFVKAAAPGRHRCRVCDVATLLYDKRWLGADGVLLELWTDEPDEAIDVAREVTEAFEKVGLRGNVEAVPGRSDRQGMAVEISGVRYDKQVEAAPLLGLAAHMVWAEPNKLQMVPESRRPRIVRKRSMFVGLLEFERAYYENEQRVLVQLMAMHKRAQAAARPGGFSNSKAGFVFHAVQSIRKALSALHVDAVQAIEFCRACERIVRVYGLSEVVPRVGGGEDEDADAAEEEEEEDGLVAAVLNSELEIEAEAEAEAEAARARRDAPPSGAPQGGAKK